MLAAGLDHLNHPFWVVQVTGVGTASGTNDPVRAGTRRTTMIKDLPGPATDGDSRRARPVCLAHTPGVVSLEAAARHTDASPAGALRPDATG